MHANSHPTKHLTSNVTIMTTPAIRIENLGKRYCLVN